jgi:hypothetical protein
MVVVFIALLAGCADDAPSTTTSEPTATTSDLAAGTPPTDTATQANAAFTRVPAGYADCGTVILTSGWPTTTAYLAEIRSTCIADAADTGEPTQQAFWGRDDRGGIEGTFIRVDGPEAITMTSYRIDADGTVTDSGETECRALEIPDFEPPLCVTE